MKPSFRSNRLACMNYLLLLMGFIGLPVLGVLAQDIATKANQFNDQYKQEKIYLHIDRPSYWANEDIWFKAYLKDSPVPKCNLYVELLNERGSVIYKNTCWAQNGLAYGDIHLADTLSSGMYQVRAYTDWMRNFDEQWFFRRDLVIWNLGDQSKEKEADNLKARNVDFHFLPEGGTFLSGVKNRMAFKAIDLNGKGVDVKGLILDEKGQQAAIFKSGFKGMGSFEFTPEPGKRYSAEMTIGGNLPLKADLPEALASGVVMSFDAKDTSQIRLEIHEKGIMGGGKYLLVGQSEGKVCCQEEVSLTNGNGKIEMDREKFPTGIIRFTLFDSGSLPVCERLVFVNHHDQVNLTIEAEEEEYHPREKVILDISALDKDESPLTANLSLSVYQTETMYQTEDYPENILTHFLLSSELKGRIEEPAYYFKDDSLSTLLALDHLMLTHGYRYFDFKQVINGEQPNIKFQPKSGIELKGTVFSDILHRPVPNAKVTMMTTKGFLSLKEQLSDANGQFSIPDLFFYDTLHVVLQLRKENGKAVSTVEIDKTSTTSPNATILPLTYDYNDENSQQKVNYLSDIRPEFLNRKWHLRDTILLEDINVKARRKEKRDGVPRPYIEPDQVIDIEKLNNVYHYLLETLEVNSPLYRNLMIREAKFFINGVFDTFGMVEDIPASSVSKVEFVRTIYRPGFGYGPGIFVYTKRGGLFENIEYSPGIVPAQVMGFSVIRNYYSPKYDGKDDIETSDFRSSLYWNPVLITDSEGLTWASFYNSNQLGEFQVVVEGLTAEGKICRGVYKYTVTPAQNK